MRVVADAMLTDPDSGCSVVGEQHHGLLGDRGSWAKHQDTERGGRDMDNTLLIHGCDRMSVTVYLTVLEIHEADAILDPGEIGELGRRHSGNLHRVPPARASVNRPHP